MERTRYQSRGIARLREVVAEPVVDEVGHALGRSRLPAVALHPCHTFESLLESHHGQIAVRGLGSCRSVVYAVDLALALTADVLGTNLDNHS